MNFQKKKFIQIPQSDVAEKIRRFLTSAHIRSSIKHIVYAHVEATSVHWRFSFLVRADGHITGYIIEYLMYDYQFQTN